MIIDKQLQILVSFLESRDINVKSDRGNFKGGLVRYHDDRFMYLNRKLDPEAKIKLIVKEIQELNLSKDEFDDEILNIIKEYES
jgi:hypothetical protein